jgi:hypothetical protein
MAGSISITPPLMSVSGLDLTEWDRPSVIYWAAMMENTTSPKVSKHREKRWRRKINRGFTVCLINELRAVLKAWSCNGVADKYRVIAENASMVVDRIEKESSAPLILPQVVGESESPKIGNGRSKYGHACRNALTCVISEAQRSYPVDPSAALGFIVLVLQEVILMQNEKHERFMETAVARAKAKMS